MGDPKDRHLVELVLVLSNDLENLQKGDHSEPCRPIRCHPRHVQLQLPSKTCIPPLVSTHVHGEFADAEALAEWRSHEATVRRIRTACGTFPREKHAGAPRELASPRTRPRWPWRPLSGEMAIRRPVGHGTSASARGVRELQGLLQECRSRLSKTLATPQKRRRSCVSRGKGAGGETVLCRTSRGSSRKVRLEG